MQSCTLPSSTGRQMHSSFRAAGQCQRTVVQHRLATASRRSRTVCMAAESPAELAPVRQGRFISKVEVPAFIQRDDLMDQLLQWAKLEAEENGLRNFGMPMKVEPRYKNDMLWGYAVEVSKEGIKRTDLGISFDDEVVSKAEFIGRDENGFPTREGRMSDIIGKHLEIWKLDEVPVDEDLRETIRSFCTGLITALNKYYAFGSVWSEDL